MYFAQTCKKVWSFLAWELADPVGKPEYEDRWLTLPNFITFTGMVACIIHAILLIWYPAAWWTLLFTVFAGLTDGLDGLAARITGQCSKLGRILDPVRDWMIVIVQLVQLGILGGFWSYFSGWFIVMVQAEVKIIRLGKSGYITSHHVAGKVRRVVQVVMLGLFLTHLLDDSPWPSQALGQCAAWFFNHQSFSFFVLMTASLTALACYSFTSRERWLSVYCRYNINCNFRRHAQIVSG